MAAKSIDNNKGAGKESGPNKESDALAAYLAAYPEHQKVQALSEQIKGAQRLAQYLAEMGVFLCWRDDATTEEFTPAESMYDGETISGQHILTAFGVSYHAFLFEKEAMMEAASQL